MGRLFHVDGPAPGIFRFVYDGDALALEYNGSGAILRRYVHGADAGADDPLVWYEGSAVNASTRRYMHTDPRGSIVLVTDYLGTKVVHNTYDEYGIPGSTNDGRFQYTGQAWIPELGMYYYKARIYSPTLGRFLQTDPIGYEDQWNLYAYVGNDPVNRTDPTGKIQASSFCAWGGCAYLKGGPSRTVPGRIRLPLPAVGPTDVNGNGTDDAEEAGRSLEGILEGLEDAASSVCSWVPSCAITFQNEKPVEPSEGAEPGRETKGPTRQFEKPGGIGEANDDFDAANPSDVVDRGGGIRTGKLDDGRTIIVRPRSTDGRPTVEVRRPNGRGYEVRYGTR